MTSWRAWFIPSFLLGSALACGSGSSEAPATAGASSEAAGGGQSSGGGDEGAPGGMGGAGGVGTGGDTAGGAAPSVSSAGGAGGSPMLAVGDLVPDFDLRDVNPTSATYQQTISPRAYLGKVTGWYFGHATWSYCGAQFGRLDEMQAELEAASTTLEVQIFGVNEDGHQSGTATYTEGRDLPLLEEGPGDAVWDTWNITYRDVVVVDADNEVVAIYNLTSNNLADTANYDALRQLFLEAAGSD